MTIKTKDGLPAEAYAIVGDRQQIDTWKLPHHTQALTRLMRRSEGRASSRPRSIDSEDIEHTAPSPQRAASGTGRREVESTVDWDRMGPAVAALSPGGYRGQRVDATAEEVLAAAKHLAGHYRAAGKPVPDTLQALL